MTIGEKIKQLRKEKNWSQDELAEKLHINATHLSRYETGKLIPSPAAIVKLAQAFNVSSDYLLTDKQVRAPLKHEYDEMFLAKLEEVEKLTDDEKNALLLFIDSLVARHKLSAILNAPQPKEIYKKKETEASVNPS